MSNVMGVDVGQSSIKLVEISRDGNNKLILENLGEIKSPLEDWKSGKGKAIGEMAEVIKKMINELKIKSKQVVVSMPETEVVSRLVRLPPLKETEIRDVLKFEAETFVPYPLDQVSIDYEIVEKDDAGRLTVFVIAAKNDLIQSYIKLFKLVGLELLALESASVSMKRIVGVCMESIGGMIVLELGEKNTNIVSINQGSIYLARSLSVGGESITRSISINLGLDMASAEEYKKAYGMKETELEGKIRNAVMPVFQNIAEEVRKAMASFLEEHNKPVDLLVLSGGGANLPGMAEELTKMLGVEVQIIQPFLKIDTAGVKTTIDIKVEGCRFSLAAGSALRGIV